LNNILCFDEANMSGSNAVLSYTQNEILLGNPLENDLQLKGRRFLETAGTKATTKTYSLVLREFGIYFSKLPENMETSARFILAAEVMTKQLRSQMEQRQSSQSTVRKKMSVLSSFFEFLVQENTVPRNPMHRLKRPVVDKNTRSHCLLTEVEAKALLLAASQAREQSTTKRGSQQAWKTDLALRLYLTCGCRVGELLKLRETDVEILDDTRARLHFHAKGAQAHSPLVPAALAKEILNYSRKEHGLCSQMISVFAGGTQKESAERTLGKAIKTLVLKAGIAKQVTIHTLRATVTSLLHARGTPVVKIQKLLGHRNLSTTEVYIRGVENDGYLDI
jgi:site-specific recombinase XerD